MHIALISDIHFGKNSRSLDFAIPGQHLVGESESGQSLYRGLEKIVSDFEPKYIICAGDLTSEGKPLEFKYCLEKLYALAKASNVPRDNVIFCFGNHDVDREISGMLEKMPEGLNRPMTEDETTFVSNYYSFLVPLWLQTLSRIGPNPTQGERYRNQIGPVPLSGLVEYDDLIVCIMNSGYLCASEQIIPHGKLGAAQLEWLKEKLIEHKDKNKWKIVLLHHHAFNLAFPEIAFDVSALEEGAELKNLCGDYGVNLVIHGHRHHPRATTLKEDSWNNPVSFICAGSLSVDHTGRSAGSIPNTFHLLKLEDMPGHLELITYEYSLGTGWEQVTHKRPTLPLDKIKHLGILRDSTVERDLIRNLDKEIAIRYENIATILQYIPVDELNTMISEIHSSTSDIIGEFPKLVCITEKKGIKDHEKSQGDIQVSGSVARKRTSKSI